MDTTMLVDITPMYSRRSRGSMSPLYMRSICLVSVDFPDCPAPKSSSLWIFLFISSSTCSSNISSAFQESIRSSGADSHAPILYFRTRLHQRC